MVSLSNHGENSPLILRQAQDERGFDTLFITRHQPAPARFRKTTAGVIYLKTKDLMQQAYFLL
jgi:hypothetical protein